MKYIVSDATTFSFSDGTKFTLLPGIHDSSAFPENVQKHWAFPSYATPLDAADLEKEQQGKDQTQRIALLEAENTSLKAQLEDRESTITDLGNEVTRLKAQLEALAAGGKPADAGENTDNPAAAEGVKNAKKQQTAN